MGIADQIYAQRELKRRQERAPVLWDLFAFATDVLGYDKLSKEFHGPMLAEWDRIDRQRLMGGRPIDTLDLWPRDHIKTWCERARIIRAYLVKPDLTVTWWHSIADMAEESAVVIGKQLQSNPRVRKLAVDGMLPAPSAKKFVTAQGFSLRSNRIGDAPSMRAWGAGSEATGGHSLVGVLDDPLGFNDVQDNQFANKRKWYQATVRNVVRSNGWLDCIGTRWDVEDMYGDWLASPYWKSKLRACLETDGVPDYEGKPVYLTIEQIKRKQVELGPVMFSMQMMNDVSQSEAAPWKSEQCEQYVRAEDAQKGPGFWVLIMDPAAAGVGGEDFYSERARGDGSKNYWAMQVWKIRRREMKVERILMDARSSRDWSMEEGMGVACDLVRKWGPACHHVGIEDMSPFIYIEEFKRVMRSRGVAATVIHLSPKGQHKNTRWGALCGRALAGEVLICNESVPSLELDRFLDQARRWVPRGGKNGLKFDDEADCAAYVVDPEIESYAPKVRFQPDEMPYSPFAQLREDAELVHGGRYIRY